MKLPCGHKPTQPVGCYLCHLYENNADYRRLWSEEVHPLHLVGDFVAAAVEHAQSGFAEASQTVKGERLALCLACEQYEQEKSSCKVCSCLVKSKVQWATSRCPLEKWGPAQPAESKKPPCCGGG